MVMSQKEAKRNPLYSEGEKGGSQKSALARRENRKW